MNAPTHADPDQPATHPGGLSIQALHDQLQQPLQLTWPQPRAGGGRLLGDIKLHDQRVPMVGYLNTIHPPQVQVVGRPEHDWLGSGRDHARQVQAALTAGATRLVVACDGQRLDADLARALADADIAVFETTANAHHVAYRLRHFLGETLARRITEHGVFLEVLSIGLLLTGDPGVGKSELALELINRGHRLVADDAPEFMLLGPDDVNGRCPPLLQDFLEVRGLGVLNIRAMFGEASIKRRKQLGLIIRLTRLDGSRPPPSDRLTGSRSKRPLLDVDIPEITLPVATGHNLSVLVEAACRDHLLRQQGYNSDEQFAQRQAQSLRGDACD